MIVVCELAEGTRREELAPFPGGDEARTQGCICPVDQRWPLVKFSTDCPVHPLEVVSAN